MPELDEDGPALLTALAARGIEALPAVWDDDNVDWGLFELVVLRSTWDYAERRGEFLRWVDSLRRVLNPPEVVRWNTDKRYLAELERAGAAVVPTAFIAPGEPFEPPASRFVVKPSVSAGARRAASYVPRDRRAHEHVRALHDAGDVAMIQPYLEQIDRAGETALLYIGGRYSHTIAKAALLTATGPQGDVLYLPETVEAREPSQAERAAAERALAAIPFDMDKLLYGRVDLVPTHEGPVVLEVEVTEPSLYLGYGDDALKRFAAAIAAELQSTSI